MRRIALIVGVSEYESNLSNLKNLPGVMGDLEGMERVLKHPPTGIFDEVKLLRNPLRQELEAEIEELFSDCQDDDLVLFFFSGHGIKTEGNRLYFAARDTNKRPNGTLVEHTTVAASTVNHCMNNCRAKQRILILNCCFSGAFLNQPMDDGSIVDIKEQLGGHLNDKGWIILTSSTKLQYTFERVYTRHLIKGIETGEVETGEDSLIQVDALHEYLVRKVRESTPNMHPQIYASGNILKVPIAKSPILPEEKYRREVKRLARRTGGEINEDYQRMLHLKSGRLKLEQGIAQEVLAEVLEPYQQYKQEFIRIYSPELEIGLLECSLLGTV